MRSVKTSGTTSKARMKILYYSSFGLLNLRVVGYVAISMTLSACALIGAPAQTEGPVRFSPFGYYLDYEWLGPFVHGEYRGSACTGTVEVLLRVHVTAKSSSDYLRTFATLQITEKQSAPRSTYLRGRIGTIKGIMSFEDAQPPNYFEAAALVWGGTKAQMLMPPFGQPLSKSSIELLDGLSKMFGAKAELSLPALPIPTFPVVVVMRPDAVTGAWSGRLQISQIGGVDGYSCNDLNLVSSNAGKIARTRELGLISNGR